MKRIFLWLILWPSLVFAGASGGSVTSNSDHYGIQQYNAPNGELTAIPLYKLVGDAFFGTVLDTGVWTPSIGTGGTVGVSNGVLVMSTGTTANNATSLISTHVARFSGLAPNKIRVPLQIPDGGTVNNTRRWGVYTATDGAFFELNGTTLKCVTRRASADSAISSGSFNGQSGPTFAPGTSSHFYEIIYQPRQVVFLADNKTIHTLSAAAVPWSNTLNLPIQYENFNTGGSVTDVAMQVRLGAVARFGIPEVQKDSFFQQGLTAGVVLKYGPGNIHSLVISGVTNNAVVTLYDNTAASGTVIFTTGAMAANTVPFSIDLGSSSFNNGLTLTVTGFAANAYVVFD